MNNTNTTKTRDELTRSGKVNSFRSIRDMQLLLIYYKIHIYLSFTNNNFSL
jgi:hypothetical protein